MRMTKNAKDFLTGFLKSNLIIIGVIIVIALTPFQDLLESDYIILIFNFSVLFISFHNFFDKEDKIEIE